MRFIAERVVPVSDARTDIEIGIADSVCIDDIQADERIQPSDREDLSRMGMARQLQISIRFADLLVLIR